MFVSILSMFFCIAWMFVSITVMFVSISSLFRDITQKGYEKKRSKLIGAFFPQAPGMDPSVGQERRAPVTPSSSSRYHRRRSSGSRDERYRSDVHTEAVQAALAKHKERKMAVPMPSKRRSLVVQTSMDAYTPPDTSSGSEGEGQGGDGDGGEGGDGEEEDGGGGGGGGGGTSSSREGSISMEHWISRAMHGTSSTTTTTSSTASSSSSSTRSGGSGAAGGRLADVLAQHVHISAHHHHNHRRHHHHHHHHHHKTDVTGYTNNTAGGADGIQVERAPGAAVQRQTPKYGNAELMETGDAAIGRVGVVPSQASSVVRSDASESCHRTCQESFSLTHQESFRRTRQESFCLTRQESCRRTRQESCRRTRQESCRRTLSSRVSAKIQQLVNTLKRPKRPPLREFFVDDFEELLEVQQPDPNQPKAEGAQMVAMRGEQLGVVTNWPPSLEAALQRWGTISPKAPCLTTMDTNGKPLYVLTYGKLWSRSVKVAYNLLHKLGSKQEPLVRPGDRVALVFPNNDPAAFMTAFYGCLLAEVVPVPIEVPLTRKDAGSQQIGFLLGSCGVTVALTSDACHKGLPKSPTGEIPQFKAETIVNVLDFKKDVGLWHAVLTSVMNMMHVISIPYALMKVNPLSWIQKVCQFKGNVTCSTWARAIVHANGLNNAY
ncbi:hypothetical protein F2P81_000141 [Scophthalmus maximus]|uniref:DMAP1-binding domain-containing protein n=1 Tax=Scophthalmus maximus TaxID=52904 RepID=A0A6A4TQ78_SCOMX|nr:hypothetical protein F2P81_000141 [Scophthalmus maximus]